MNTDPESMSMNQAAEFVQICMEEVYHKKPTIENLTSSWECWECCATWVLESKKDKTLQGRIKKMPCVANDSDLVTLMEQKLLNLANAFVKSLTN